jgi:hypothetical protein
MSHNFLRRHAPIIGLFVDIPRCEHGEGLRFTCAALGPNDALNSQSGRGIDRPHRKATGGDVATAISGTNFVLVSLTNAAPDRSASPPLSDHSARRCPDHRQTFCRRGYIVVTGCVPPASAPHCCRGGGTAGSQMRCHCDDRHREGHHNELRHGQDCDAERRPLNRRRSVPAVTGKVLMHQCANADGVTSRTGVATAI